MLNRSRLAASFTLLIAGVAGFAAYYVGVLTRTGQLAEASVLETANYKTDPGFPINMVSPLSVFLSLGVLVVLTLAVWSIRRALVVLLASLTALFGSQLLKNVLLDRPVLIDAALTHNSFPSGHMTAIAVLGIALIFAVPAAIRGFMSALVGFGLSIVALQVMTAGWHRPSDMVGALALTIGSYALWSLIIAHGDNKIALLGSLVRFLLRVLFGLATLVALIFLIFAAFTRSDAAIMVGAYTAVIAACIWVANRATLLLR
ncbi:hypothetical protein [Canibacter zhoujuaniae]|uniref:hypothetical protein n=1 Tax=Canibacter zhoujuaniae TaxID=2708343 RepID=UPI0014221600|nr:hypothetical protein [Canibacter zhoujuaniae]